MNPDRIRNSLSALTSDLRSRKVLAAAGLLVIVAIAVPLLLSHSGTPTSLAALPPAPTITAPVPTAAAVSTTRNETPPERILTGPAHNPFLAPASKTASKDTASQAASAKTTGAAISNGATERTKTSSTGSAAVPASSKSTSGKSTRTTHSRAGGSADSGQAAATQQATTVTTPALTVTVTKTVTRTPMFTDYAARISMRQEGTNRTPKRLNRVARFQLLPADNGAFASFLGIRSDKKTAVFVLANGVTVAGQGRCAPSSSRCVFLTLQPGDSVRLQAPDWAGSKTFTLRYPGVRLITSSASVVDVDQIGWAVVKKAAADFSSLRTMTYGHYTSLLSITLRRTAPAATQLSPN